MSLQTRLASLITEIGSAFNADRARLAALEARRSAWASYVQSAAQNVNTGANESGPGVFVSNWAAERQDADFSYDGAAIVTVAGTPDIVELYAQVALQVPDANNSQRPNQICTVIRVNDGKVIGHSSTGYIRDATDHEQSSYNIKIVDTAPLANSQYTVNCLKETTNNGVVNTRPDRTRFQLKAEFS